MINFILFFSFRTSSNVMRESVSEGCGADENVSMDESLSDAADEDFGRSQIYGTCIPCVFKIYAMFH